MVLSKLLLIKWYPGFWVEVWTRSGCFVLYKRNVGSNLIKMGTFTSANSFPFTVSVLAVKRLMKEAAELRDPTEHYHAQPLEVRLKLVYPKG